MEIILEPQFNTIQSEEHTDLNKFTNDIKNQLNMNYLKTGLIISTIIILLAMIFLHYDILGVNTVKDVFIIPAFIINASLIYKIFKTRKEVA